MEIKINDTNLLIKKCLRNAGRFIYVAKNTKKEDIIIFAIIWLP